MKRTILASLALLAITLGPILKAHADNEARGQRKPAVERVESKSFKTNVYDYVLAVNHAK